MDACFGVLDRIDDFSLNGASPDKWESWYKQFSVLLRVAAFENLPNGRRVALLLTKLKGFTTVLNALGIDDATIAYDDLLSKLAHYFNPFNARMAFFNRMQKKYESFDTFAAALKTLSGPCQFLDPKVVRDMFLCNMHKDHREVALLIMTKYDPSLEEAVAVANGFAYGSDNHSGIDVTPSAGVQTDGSSECRQQSSRNNNSSTRQPFMSGSTFSSVDSVPEYKNRGSNDIIDGQYAGTQDARESSQQTHLVPRSVEMDQGTRTNATRQTAKPKWQLQDAYQLPLDSFTLVHVVHKSPTGKIYCVRKNLESELHGLNDELSDLPDTDRQPVVEPTEGDLVLARDEYGSWYRAEIVRIYAHGQQVKIRFIDIGLTVKTSISEIRVLPRRFWNIKPFAFPIEVCSGLIIHEDDSLLIMPTMKTEEGVWKVNIKMRGLEETSEPELNELATVKPLTSFVAAQAAPKPAVSQRSIEPVTARPVPKPARLQRSIEPVAVRPVPKPARLQRSIEPVAVRPAPKPAVSQRSIEPVAVHPAPKPAVSQRSIEPVTARPVPKPARLQRSIEPVAVRPAPKPAGSQRSVEAVAVQPSLKPTSRGADVPRPPRHPPPIPRTTFSKFKVLYVGSEGMFGMEWSKLSIIGNIHDTIKELTLQHLLAFPEVGSFCLAPFEGGMFRARVSSSVRERKCSIEFLDFGNKSEIHIDDLRRIPEELLRIDIYVFKFRICHRNITPKIGDILYVRPIDQVEDGSWLLEVKGEPSSPPPASADESSDSF